MRLMHGPHSRWQKAALGAELPPSSPVTVQRPSPIRATMEGVRHVFLVLRLSFGVGAIAAAIRSDTPRRRERRALARLQVWARGVHWRHAASHYSPARAASEE